MRASSPVITVDGPSGTGKGTLCSRISRWLQWNVLDSGALYRILALLAQRERIDISNVAEVVGLAEGLDVEFIAATGDIPVKVTLNGRGIDAQIRTEDCGGAASNLARYAEVRDAILGWQRSFQRPPGLVADGRDMGTVVFPGAELKIFLTASPGERAKRRYKQLNVKGIDVNLRDLSAEIDERDSRDRQRSVSPLKPAEDAVVIDTSASGIEDVFARVSVLIKQRFEASAQAVDRRA